MNPLATRAAVSGQTGRMAPSRVPCLEGQVAALLAGASVKRSERSSICGVEWSLRQHCGQQSMGLSVCMLQPCLAAPQLSAARQLWGCAAAAFLSNSRITQRVVLLLV